MSEIQRLKSLLKGKKEEYEIFGKTAQDREEDNKIIDKIKELEAKNGSKHNE